MNTPTLIGWSGGKDSALALWMLAAAYQPMRLITHLDRRTARVTGHGVHRSLIARQAQALGVPVDFVLLDVPTSNADYEATLAQALRPHLDAGIRHMVFGDLFLADIRAYREAQMDALGMEALFPLWQQDTAQLAETFITAGFKTIITCVDSSQLDPQFVGRLYDHALLRELPTSVDPCGENGEFHTFVFDGPLFDVPLMLQLGAHYPSADERFWYADLALA